MSLPPGPTCTASLVIARPSEALWEMVSDVTRMGEWSPVCVAGWWDEGGGPAVGSWFTGRNTMPEMTWETRSRVVAAERGRAFAFEVGERWTSWGYSFVPVEGGTEVTESWEVLPAGVQVMVDLFGDGARAELEARRSYTVGAMTQTLAALKRVAELTFSASVVIARPPAAVWELVSDVTRTGEWSPTCVACWWDPDPGGPAVGARFTGRNVTPQRTWETRSRVVVCEPGREFAFEVGEGYVRWGYTLAPAGGGTELTESWAFLPAGLAVFRERYRAEADTQIEDRRRMAYDGIPATLAAIRRVAETG